MSTKQQHGRKFGCLKGCLYAFAAVAAIVALAAAGLAYMALSTNRQYGWMEAPAVVHEDYAGPETRVRAVMRPHKIADLITQNIPQEYIDDSPLPAMFKERVRWVVDSVLPNELALFSYSDYLDNRIRFRLFMNERRFGPLLAERLNESLAAAEPGVLEWDPALWSLPSRGVLYADGSLPLPAGVASAASDHWRPRPATPPILVTGDHLVEAVVDNRTGEGLTLIAMAAEALGFEFSEMIASQQGKQLPMILTQLTDGRLTGNMIDDDEMKLDMTIQAVQGAGIEVSVMTLLALNTGIQPELAQMLQEMGFTLTGQARWDPSIPGIVGEYRLAGFRAFIQDLLQAQPAAAPETFPAQTPAY